MIEQTNKPTFRITCDRCKVVWEEVGNGWAVDGAMKAERLLGDKLMAMPGTSAQMTLCEACADSYEAWWRRESTV